MSVLFYECSTLFSIFLIFFIFLIFCNVTIYTNIYFFFIFFYLITFMMFFILRIMLFYTVVFLLSSDFKPPILIISNTSHSPSPFSFLIDWLITNINYFLILCTTTLLFISPLSLIVLESLPHSIYSSIKTFHVYTINPPSFSLSSSTMRHPSIIHFHSFYITISQPQHTFFCTLFHWTFLLLTLFLFLVFNSI